MKRQALLANIGTIVAFVIFGGATAATRVAGRAIPPFTLAVLRFGLAGTLLLLVLALVARRQLVVARQDWLLFLGMGITFAAFAFCFNLGLRFTEASRGGLMLSTAPLWSAVLARLFGWERLTVRQVAGLLLTFIGIVLVVAERGLHWRSDGRGLLGDALMLLAVFLSSLNLILTKFAYRRYAPLPVVVYTMLLSAALLLIAALPEGLPAIVSQMSGVQVRLVLFLGLPAGAFAYYLIFVSLRYLTPTQTSVYININPLTATIIGAALLGERLTLIFIVGAVIVLVGVLLVNLPKTLGLRRKMVASGSPA